MNFGLLSGLFQGYEIIGTQNSGSQIYDSVNCSSNGKQGVFYAPPEATHALISACAGSLNGGGWDDTTDPPNVWYGNNGGSGGGAACYRVPFDLSAYRFIPWFLESYTKTTVRIGAYSGSFNVNKIIKGPFPAIYLKEGTYASGGSSMYSGGNGGAATYSMQYLTSPSVITANGGAGGGSCGSVVALPSGGYISGGSGGGGTGAAGGHLHTPFGIRKGGSGNSSYGGGGASFYADGLTGLADTSVGLLKSSGYYGAKIGSAYPYWYPYAIPGAGMPGTALYTDGGYSGLSFVSTSFIYCEFIAPR